METELGWEDFVLLFSPVFFRFHCVVYIIVTVAAISPHQGKKIGIKKIPPSITLVFLFERKQS